MQIHQKSQISNLERMIIMLTHKRLFSPTPGKNPLYQAAITADLSSCDNEKSLMQAFSNQLDGLTRLADDIMETIGSLSQVMEVFYFAALAAALLQQKAKYQDIEIQKNAAPEDSLATIILSQFKGLTAQGNEELINEIGKTGYETGKNLAVILSQDFSYAGRAMRALTTVSMLSHTALRADNDKRISTSPLLEYEPTSLLLQKNATQRFSVIGAYDTERIRSVYSSPSSVVRFTRDAKSAFCKVFSNKLLQLLSQSEMDRSDRTRLEELRDYYADALCQNFFNVKLLNFPRIIHFVAAINENSDESGRISEEDLASVTPPECAAFLGYDSILIKDAVDMDTTWYRVNVGIKGFAELTRQFNLLGGHKQALLDEVVRDIK